MRAREGGARPADCRAETCRPRRSIGWAMHRACVAEGSDLVACALKRTSFQAGRATIMVDEFARCKKV